MGGRKALKAYYEKGLTTTADKFRKLFFAELDKIARKK